MTTVTENEQETEGYKEQKKKEILEAIAAWKPSVAEQELFNHEDYWEQSAEEAVKKLDKRLGWNNGGSNDDGSGKGGNGKRNKQKEKLEYSTFKYSTRFTGPLHEAIMIGSEPCFVTYSAGHLDTVRKIEEANRILVPPYPEEYPSYEPFEFQSKKELQEYIDMALNETIDSLYQRIKTQVSLYVDQDAEVINLISGDIIWTFFQDQYATTHYYDVTGKENGIGKSTIGYMFQAIGYRGVRMTDPSAANLYRILGTVETGQCIIIADEADRIHQDRDMLSILKEGYAMGGKVPKINTNTLKQEFFHCYGFKIRIAEESLRGNITKGVIDRSFQIKASKGRPTHDIKEVLHPANKNERLEKLHNDLMFLRKLLLAYRLIHFSDSQPDIETGLEGRNKELCKPLLHLFNGSKAYVEIEATLQAFLDRKNKRKKNTAIEPVVYGTVIDLVSRLGNEIATSQVWNAITCGTTIQGSYEPKKPNEYQTNDYGLIKREEISKSICDNFGAEREHKRDGNVFVFDEVKLAKAGKAYDIEASIQTKLPSIEHEGREGREGREGQYSPMVGNTDAEILEIAKKNEKISNKDIKNQETSLEMKDKEVPNPMVEPSQPSQPSHIRCTIHRRGNTDLYGCNDCKMRGDKWFMQEHHCNGIKDRDSRIKVADAAAANLSGNGVLFGDKKKSDK